MGVAVGLKTGEDALIPTKQAFMKLEILNNAQSELTLKWADGSPCSFHAIWLRDNCRCVICGEPSVGRRKLRLGNLDLEVSITAAEIAEGGELVCITWSDGHTGSFASNWLRRHRYDNESRRQRAFKPQLWTDKFRREPPTRPYNDVVNNDDAFMQILCTVRDFGFCFLTGAPTEPGTVENLAGKLGFPQESNFGRVQDLVVDARQRSIANDVDELKPHTDEPYRASPPGILLFHCITTELTGTGSSTFLDGFEAAETLRREDPEGFASLARNSQEFRRHFDGDVDLIAEFPVISVDSFGNLCGVRINDRVAAPACIAHGEIPVYYRAMQRLLQLAEDENRIIKKILRPGDIAIFDNHRILHGRTKLTLNGKRWLQWVQVERGDFHSTLRILADKLNLERDALPLLRGAYG